MQVKEIMTTNVAALAPDNTIMDAAKSMQTHNIDVCRCVSLMESKVHSD